MKPVFHLDGNVYPIATLEYSDSGIRQVGYLVDNKIKFVVERNEYSIGTEMIENLESYVKWENRYDLLMSELEIINDKKTAAHDEAAHNLVLSLDGTTTHQMHINNYHVASGQVVATDDIIAVVSLLDENEKNSLKGCTLSTSKL